MTQANPLNAMLLCDFYKISHRKQYPEGTQVIYSTLTPRTNKYAPVGMNEVVSFGFQKFVKEYLIDFFNNNFFKRNLEEIEKEYTEVLTLAGMEVEFDHIKALHKLGYLPLKVDIIPEGTLVPVKVPVMTIENTHPDFFWLTNYFETLISCGTWQYITSATIAAEYRTIGLNFAEETCDDDSHLDFQFHDFSMRGMSSLESAINSGMGHLLSFVGTDTIPAILAAKHYYGSNGVIGTSIPATEHSVMSANAGLNGYEDEYETYRRLIQDIYPNGYVSIVSDTFDFWKVVTQTLPRLKEIIEARDGKVVIRPDSGDPVDILCGTVMVNPIERLNNSIFGNGYYTKNGEVVKVTAYGKEIKISPDDRTVEEKGLIEVLWEIFGGTVNSKGFKVLNPKIGAIYGDSITLQRAENILYRLARKGFASSNVVFGVGSFTYQYNTRDTFGFAVKSTAATIGGKEVAIFKDPKTDSGMKKSQRGRVLVFSDMGELKYRDGLTKAQVEEHPYTNEMVTIFLDGKLLVDESFDTIKQRLRSYI